MQHLDVAFNDHARTRSLHTETSANRETAPKPNLSHPTTLGRLLANKAALAGAPVRAHGRNRARQIAAGPKRHSSGSNDVSLSNSPGLSSSLSTSAFFCFLFFRALVVERGRAALTMG